MRNHYHENKDKINEYKKEYREKNKEIISQKAKEKHAIMKEKQNSLKNKSE